jgi:3-dehydroquinate synthase
MSTRRIHVRSQSGSYTVAFGRGLLTKAGAEVKALGDRTGLYLLISPRVARRWRAPVEKALRPAGLSATIVFDDREISKNMQTVESICRELVRAGADRRAVIVAAGGGVVGDVAGFAAASFLRGVRLVHLPTTLVAQVDSAIGGKTGVNLPEGKNLVGAFYPPRLVLADPNTLSTLPLREYRSGLYEVIKYGVIGDARLFQFLEGNIERVIRRGTSALNFVVPRCIRAKASIVSRDERESGLREILNFGHTFAHALETATGYRRYLHGEAVGWGMIAASRLAQVVGMLAESDAQRIETLVRRSGPLPPFPQKDPARLVEIMGADKKTRGGELRFVLPHRIGRVETVSGIPVNRVWQVLADLQTEDARPRRGAQKR